MTWCAVRAGILARAMVLWLLAAGPSTGADDQLIRAAQRPQPDLFDNNNAYVTRRLTVDAPGRQLRHRLYLEVEGARSHAGDWLRDTGFSLLEDRDGDGRRSYQLVSRTLTDEWPALRLHTRLGGPQLSAGLRPRHEVPAIGVTIPWQRYTLEVEGLDDRALGWALMGRLRWSDASEHVQYGIAVPITVGAASVGALLQVRIRFGE